MHKFKNFVLIVFPSFVSLAFGDELLRPSKISDFSNLNQVTAEKMTRIEGVEVAWANYNQLRIDFPFLQQSTDNEINTWLIRQFSYIGSNQIKLEGIRNSKLPTTNMNNKIGIRPGDSRWINSNWKRSAMLEARDSNGIALGLVDVKGVGHGAQTFGNVDDQLFAYKKSGGKQDAIDALRIKDHSDGLMSFGEAVAEVSRQQAAQKLFDLAGNGMETVESYAIIFSIAKIPRDSK